MLITQEREFALGYTAITDMDTCYPEMLLDFGIFKLNEGQEESNADDKERAFILMKGEMEIKWDNKSFRISRQSLFDESPWCIHLPAKTGVTIKALSQNVEIALQSTTNSNQFDGKIYSPQECRIEHRGKGTMQETSTRTVRTIFDDSTAPHANLVLGEVITFPGKWSSYPPHHHPQPEIYHYRFLPEHGFGFTAIGKTPFLLHNNDTILIHSGEVHPQVTAPGYAMYYIWVIRHLDERRYVTPTFEPQHTWVIDPDVKIWPT